MYNEEKIKKFHEYTLDEYNQSLIIEDIAKTNTTVKTDGSFTQIGIRPIVDDDIFILPNFHPELPGAGRMVAIGERDFLIQSILDDKNIKRIDIKEDIKEFPKFIEYDSCVIISTKFYVEIFTNLMHRIDYEEKYPRLDYRYRMISIPEKVLGSKIIIIDKNAIIWERQIFDNKTLGRKEKLDINIKTRLGGKVDITIRSVNKIKYLNPDLIKILEVNLND